MPSTYTLLYSLLVSLIWGLTNPFLPQSSGSSPLTLLPLVLNQLGSLLFNWKVLGSPGSLAACVPAVNAMTQVFTFVAGYAIA
eukprot:CAMPEP_0182475920 /NCGR_PEP_ID=MMETSP1319-20130603/28178_1 /TAXON_ID=172717 /ORGANISM="Bolidomonas pacifica, Strain RCC208" /LENGTH=82 /DNA_ID=CAMNT_0024676961 /DNA_START=188 /DNA_END=432 /DNA_ORIENTATION=+